MNDPNRSIEPVHEPDVASLREIAALAIDTARRKGASASEAMLSRTAGLAVNVRLGEVETIEHTRDNNLGVTVYFENRKGSASSTDFSASAVRETVDAACRIARHTARDEFSGLADPERMAVDPPDLDLFHPWPISTDEAIAIALETETAARDHDARITNSDGASVSKHEGDYAYGNSHGFLEGYSTSRHGLSCVVIAEDASGMQRDYWYSAARDPARLEPASLVGLTAGQRTIRRLGARKIETRRRTRSLRGRRRARRHRSLPGGHPGSESLPQGELPAGPARRAGDGRPREDPRTAAPARRTRQCRVRRRRSRDVAA